MKTRFNNAVGPQVRTKAAAHKFYPIMAALALVSGIQASTQFFAHIFRYQASLGDNFHHIYLPYKILLWLHKWHGSYIDEFTRSASVGMVVSSVALLGVFIAKVVSSNSSKPNKYLHGSARWAESKDIVQAGLLPRKHFWSLRKNHKTDFVYVGAWQDKDGVLHYLRHYGPEHVLTYAPTRSGKGVALVLPTLLSWSQSCVITDLKGELWALTSGWRKQHAQNITLRFEPGSLNGGVTINPLDEIRLGTEYEVGDVQNLSYLLVDPDGKGLITHWQKTSFALFVGLILHALYKARNGDGPAASLPLLDAMLADPARPTDDLWIEMTTYGHINGENHPAVGASARDQMDRPEEEAGSVLSTAKSFLALYRDPVVARNVSTSGFRIKDLMNHEKPVSLYIVTHPNDKSRMRPLVRLLLDMILRLLADKLEFVNGRPKAHYKHPLLMMMDEFPSLGKLDIFQESLAYVAGYGIKCYLICQDINQLKSREIGYGPDETITSNCHIQNCFPPQRPETADYMSRMTGQTTVAKEQITTSGKRASMMLGRVSRTYHETQRPLLTVDECLRMPGPVKDDNNMIVEAGDMVIFVGNHPAIYGKQPLYFKDPIFSARAAIQAPKTSDIITQPHQDAVEDRITI